jgi:hypothetical protein
LDTPPLIDWNIPKHLAYFDWQEKEDGSTVVKVYPHDTTEDPHETTASKELFFQTTFKPMAYVPSFPLSTSLLGYIGIDAELAQPPLPEGKGSQGELPGTDKWCSVMPGQKSRKASLGWFDIRQTDEQGTRVGDYENFWPGLGRWQVGLKLKDSEIEFGQANHWDPPKSVL